MRSKHEIPTASVGSSQAPTDAVEISALRSTRQTSTYRRPFRVQTNGATSISRLRAELARVKMERDILEKATAYFAKAQR